MDNAANLELPESANYQIGRDFVLQKYDRRWFTWKGAGDHEDYCGWEAYRTAKQAAADAVFRLAISDGHDPAEAVMEVQSTGLPTNHLDLDSIDYD